MFIQNTYLLLVRFITPLFNIMQEISSLSTVSDLQSAIAQCKALVLEKEDSEEKKWLVRRLIELRLRLENIRHTSEENIAIDDVNNRNKVVLGHHFSLQSYQMPSVNLYCDRCSGIIWNVLHNWYLCSGMIVLK